MRMCKFSWLLHIQARRSISVTSDSVSICFLIRPCRGLSDITCSSFPLKDGRFHIVAEDGAEDVHDLTQISVGRLGNFALEEAIQNTGQYTTQRVDTVQIVQSRLFRLVCQSLDKVGTAQRINGIDDATLIGDDLLSA